ncbi:MBL fold metallo-hydrolase [Nemorincola caseinilytica]|uniref:MBL fold metallo-hydrolase n=1 Tax=Nemorincola caseinilytica TaxID=2054315 RepID=A0ABP8NDZ0_9BACT
MLNVHFFTFNAFSENTYIISDHKKDCWIVDPGMYEQRETDEFISFIEKQQLRPRGIINTHAHLDHIFGVNALKERYNIPFGIHRQELPVLQRGADTAAMFGMQLSGVPVADNYIPHGIPLQLGDDTIEVLLTPGHSPGSISFYYAPGNWVIAGDVLFNGSIGRTDLPGGNFDTLISSIRTQLFPLPDGTVVLSGHGPATTIGDEKADNPFLS